MEQNSQRDLQTLSHQALANGIFHPDDVIQIQTKLWALLAQRTERYTMGDSSSVRVETAEALFASIQFSLRFYLNATGQDITCLKEEPLDLLLRASWKKIESNITKGQRLLAQVIETAPQIENISYRDTLAEIASFFKQYDYRFFAHDIPCSIDYQLCHAVSEKLEGIEYINEYLGYLCIENEFCSHFDSEIMSYLLERYCPDHKGLLINLYEPIAVNALGLSLAQESPFSLHISEEIRTKLLLLFEGKLKASGITLLSRAAEKLCDHLSICDFAAKDYLMQTAIDLYPRIGVALSTGSLDGIFFSLH